MVNKRKDFKRWALAGVKKAIVDYHMIVDGDTVAVGLSGGKDSGVLLYALTLIQKIAPIKFDLQGIFLDLGFGMETDRLQQWCMDLQVPFHVLPTDIGEIVFELRNEKNPCALCAKMCIRDRYWHSFYCHFNQFGCFPGSKASGHGKLIV